MNLAPPTSPEAGNVGGVKFTPHTERDLELELAQRLGGCTSVLPDHHAFADRCTQANAPCRADVPTRPADSGPSVIETERRCGVASSSA
ncbi:MAG: hypothetical protein ACRDSZ_20385 [Pseudonocardiaceae bacterium]